MLEPLLSLLQALDLPCSPGTPQVEPLEPALDPTHPVQSIWPITAPQNPCLTSSSSSSQGMHLGTLAGCIISLWNSSYWEPISRCGPHILSSDLLPVFTVLLMCHPI